MMDRRELLKRLGAAGLAIPAAMVIDKTLVPQLEPLASPQWIARPHIDRVTHLVEPITAHRHYHQPMTGQVLMFQTEPGTLKALHFYMDNCASIWAGEYGTGIISERGFRIEVFEA